MFNFRAAEKLTNGHIEAAQDHAEQAEAHLEYGQSILGGIFGLFNILGWSGGDSDLGPDGSVTTNVQENCE